MTRKPKEAGKPSDALVGLLEMRIPLAQHGHKDMARRVAGMIAFMLQERQQLPDVAREYLVDALKAIAGGTPGNEAFHTSGRKGVKDFSEHVAEKYKEQIAPVLYMQELLDDGDAATPHAASLITEKMFGTDGATLRKHHRKLFPPK